MWAPQHAWRALGQLRAEAAIEPLLGMLWRIGEDFDDQIGEELPKVFGLIGPVAIPGMAGYLENASNPLWARISAARNLCKIGEKHPEAAETCANALCVEMERFAGNTPVLNGFVLSYLLNRKAVGAVPVIERAFAAESIEPSIAGDWEDAQVELGLLEKRISQQNPRPKQRKTQPHPGLNTKRKIKASSLKGRLGFTHCPHSPEKAVWTLSGL